MKQTQKVSFWYKYIRILTAVILTLAVVLDNSRYFVPRVDAAPGDGHMLLFWPGGTVPTGWTCVSCTAGDPFYQIFPRGNTTYGATGGSASHGHTTTNSIAGTADAPASITEPGAALSDNTHSHSLSVTLGTASNLPAYRQLQIIRANTSGEPTTIPQNAIALFDNASLPSNWTSYSAQNGWYARGESTVGTTGGSNTHNHSIAITIGNATGGTQGIRNGSQVSSAAAGHTHTASGNSQTVNNEPPFAEVIFAQSDTDQSPPDNMLAMWDDEAPINWTSQSGSSGHFNQRFLKGSSSFGTTGGNTTHSHANTSIVTSGPSATQNSRNGSTTASGSHTHTVTIANYSTESNIPPYRDVIIAKRVPQPAVELSGYRLYQNTNSTDVGAPLSALNTSANTPKQGKLFRLRLTLDVSDANLDAGNKVFKLQVASRSGSCDVGFSGETYADVTSSSGAIRFADNVSANDGDALTDNANDPTHVGHTIINQTYEESNSFTNTSQIAAGEDGLWDFSLIDFSAAASSSYCFRVVYNSGTLLESYSVIPEIVTDDGNGHMLLLWDGVSIPSGWTCVSCAPGDEFYERFFRGSGAYGGTGGSATHTHTFGSATVANTAGLTVESQAGSGVATGGHTHTASVSFQSASNLPAYRQLRVIRADISGVPTTLPAGVIAFFDAAVPTGWTRYSAQDNNFIRAADTVASTGGANNHTHTISGSLGTGVGETGARTNGATVLSAAANHTHTVSGASTAADHRPPYIETILGKLNADAAVPQNIITMWDNPEPVSWTNVSESGQPFYERFVLPAVSYGATGGSATHSHTDSVVVSSGPSATGNHRGGTVSAGGTHTHNVTVANISTENSLPPYIEVILAKMGNLNTAPSSPASLDQKRTSDNSSIAVGEYSNGGQVEFSATVSDTDNPDSLQLCVEVVPIASSFTNSPTCGSAVTYNGTPASATVIVSGLSDGVSYHWQAQVKDSGGAVSAWVSFGANAETDADFIIDSTDPNGTVYDGVSVGVDVDFNDGSLDSLSANWSITDNGSGLASFEYAIGTTSGGTNVVNWTNSGLSASFTETALPLETSQVYYVAVRATDNAANEIVIVSDGQFVAPTLSFSASPNGVVFDGLNPVNSYTVTEQTTLTTSTNARNGYEIRAYASGLLTSINGDTINMFNGGSYASPSEWDIADTGYGYTSNDPLIEGVNKFTPALCSGGGNGPCYAPFSLAAPGDIVADNDGPIIGASVVNESFTLTHRVTTLESQNPGRYQTLLILNATARY